MEPTQSDYTSESHSSTSKSAIDESSSPYFLHHLDSPSLLLVSQPLTGDNYASWSRAMMIALLIKNKLPFIDGSMKKSEDTNPDLINSWIRNNNMVMLGILNSISKDILASVIYASTAHEIWNDQQSNRPRIFQLKKDLMNLTQDQNNVSIYFTKLKTIWEE
ncbi:uncharacterized protein LOC111408518 [Olea europaea var. sylvestris]|uniref:uncharacterized protein LOC111408518 n=1 Tax=Olea europaea var. sylvestris TaxID=158386 RepID=UPI000C1D4665|nr:uncharacterized protein LOC111408518 [Olea europaea var. sylvestris]